MSDRKERRERRAAARAAAAKAPKPSTPSSRWQVACEPDPHAPHYDGERASLCLGDLTDDELANAAFMNYDVVPPLQDVISGKAKMPIIYMTAVKDRIRWLSRRLVDAERENKSLMDAIIGFRKGNLLTVARASSDEFAKNADEADWDEIDLEESLAMTTLFDIADKALATAN